MRFISRLRGILASFRGFKLVLSVSETLLRLETPEKYSVEFTFRDRPLPEANINLYANEKTITTRRTDVDGRLSDAFTFTEPGVYNLQARFEKLDLVVESNVVTVRAGLFRLNIGTGEGGTTSPGPGTYEYRQDSAIRVLASPNSGYEFDHWTFDDIEAGVANPIPLTIDWDHRLLPFFRKLPPPPAALGGPTWQGHPIRVGERVPGGAGTPTYYMIVDGAGMGFPRQPWVSWRDINTDAPINSFPILSVAQARAQAGYSGPYPKDNPSYSFTTEDAGFLHGTIGATRQDSVENAMRVAPPAWSA